MLNVKELNESQMERFQALRAELTCAFAVGTSATKHNVQHTVKNVVACAEGVALEVFERESNEQ